MSRNILSFPREIIGLISTHVTQFDLLNLRLTCKSFRDNPYVSKTFNTLTKFFQTRCQIFVIHFSANPRKITKIDKKIAFVKSFLIISRHPFDFQLELKQNQDVLFANGLRPGDIIQIFVDNYLSDQNVTYNGVDFEIYNKFTHRPTFNFSIADVLNLRNLHPYYWKAVFRKFPFPKIPLIFDKIDLSYSVVSAVPFCENSISLFNERIGCYIQFYFRLYYKDLKNAEDEFISAAKNPNFFIGPSPFIIRLENSFQNQIIGL